MFIQQRNEASRPGDAMQSCAFCGSEIPPGAHFCGHCGQPLSDETKSVTQITTVVELREAGPLTPPGFEQFPNPSDLPLEDAWQTVENSTPLPGAILPLSALEFGQSAPGGEAPMVHGTPQPVGVPHVQGTPPVAHSAGLLARQSQTALQRASLTHSTRAASASKVVAGTAAKWIILIVTVVVVITTGGAIFVFANAPALSLSGSNSVFSGGTLSIHGKGFLPGGNVALTLDQGIPLSPATSKAIDGAARHGALGADGLLDMNLTTNRAAPNASIPVSVAGTFDTKVLAQAGWSPGQHTIHARENLGSRSADLQFTLLATSTPTPASLVVKPAFLSFSVLAGSRAVQSIDINNAGQSTLNWTATPDGSPWLKLQDTAGEIGSVSSDEFIYVTADASQLKVGSYTASIVVSSNAGNVKVSVSLQVLSPATKKQAKLDVNPTTLDFGQLSVGQTQKMTLSLADSGTDDLRWNAGTGNASWLTLDSTSGTVKQGALPQVIHVMAQTSGLTPGSYTAHLAINSNGGTAQVAVTLVVIGITPTPSPTLLPSPSPSPSPTLIPSPSPSPTLIPPAWSVSPTGLDGSTCGLSGPCTVTLTEDASSTGAIGWSASSDVKASFNPANGTLSPGTPQQVSISGMACQNGTFTFTATGSATPQTLSVAWTCTPPTPTGTASLDTCSYTAGTGWSCPLSITADTTNQVAFPWGTSSSGISGITFTPPKGSLPPGQSTTTTVAIPDGVCPASATLLVTTPGKGLPVGWSCAAPSLVVTVNTTTCPANPNGGWTCTMTLSLASGSQGQLVWSAYASSNLPGVGFSPSNGTLVVGQPVTETVTIPSTDCTNGSFNFAGNGGNTSTVTWTCPSTS